MNPPNKKTRVLHKWRWPIRLALGAGLIWGASQAAVNAPFVKSRLIQWVEAALDGNIERVGYISVSPTGRLALNDVDVASLMDSPFYRVQIDAISVSNLWRGQPVVRFRNFDMPMLKAKTGRIQLLGDWNSPDFDLFLRDVDIDLEQVSNMPRSATSETAGGGARLPIRRVQIESARLVYPPLQQAIELDLSMNQIGENGAHEINLTVHGQNKAQRGTLKLTAETTPSIAIRQARGRFDQFTWGIAGSATAEMTVNGTMALRPAPPNQYGYSSDLFISDASAKNATGRIAFADGMRLQSAARLGENFMPLSASATLHHSNIDAPQTLSAEIPEGSVNWVWSSPDFLAHQTALEWTIPDMGEVSLQASGEIFTGPPAISGSIRIASKPLSTFAMFLRPDLTGPLPALDATLDASASFSLAGYELDQYQADLSLADQQLVYAPAKLEGLTIKGHAQGGKDSHKAKVEIAIADSSIQSGSITIPIQMEPLAVDAAYNQKTNQFSIHASPFNSAWLQNIAASYSQSQGAEVSAALDLETALPLIASTFLPGVTRAWEGMGALVIEGAANFSQPPKSQASVSFANDGLSIYSFDEEPFYGVELKALRLKSQIKPLDISGVIHTAIAAATPSVVAGGFSYELPSGSATLEATNAIENFPETFFSFHPLPGSAIHGRYGKDGAIQASADALDLESFLLPLLKKYAGLEDSTFLDMAGRLSGRVEANPAQPNPVDGMIHLHDFSWRYDGVPSFFISNASVSIPVFYPSNETKTRSFRLEAEMASWQSAVYENIRWNVALPPDQIQLFETLALPLFGGRLSFKQIIVSNWQSAYPLIEGLIQIENMNMKTASEASGYIASEGILTANISRIERTEKQTAITGEVAWNAFGGKIILRNLYVRELGRYVGLDVALETLDLEKLSAYYNYGRITGQLTGHINDLLIQLPAAGSNEIPKPIRFDIDIRSVGNQENVVSGSTLQKLTELGESNVPFQQELYRRDFKYAGLGLRGVMKNGKTQIYGTQKEFYFIQPSDSLFANKVGIRLGLRDQQIDFDHVWKVLLAQINQGM